MIYPTWRADTGSAMLKVLAAVLLVSLLMGGCVASRYNGLVAGQENVDSKFSEIDNQYKRRNDLIPQLVNTIKGSASFEKSVLTQVTEARASVGKLQVPADLPSDPAAQAQYLQAQQGLGNAIGRMMMVAEAYPDLKSTAGFRDLQSQVEGTENRITVARRDYIDSIKNYNTSIRKFPGNLVAGVFGMEKVAQLEAATDAERDVPAIDFGTDE
ncbi:MAG: LemA protein [Chlamydiales bacterium]|jgi:LemA protein